ncbi:MAG: glycoside hydrolase family 3 C-terminal domain-containing protein [Clostridia bacterium]|nr:glycoside hydrolase family 3 C-terminal domain-containing protein [Clostridia bacterium]
MKKVLSVYFALMILITQCVICFAAVNIKGDVDADGAVTAGDARLALRQSAKLEQLTQRQLDASDMTGDGVVTAEDARVILRISAKLSSFAEKETEAVETMLAAMSTKEKVEQMIMTDVRYFNGEAVETLNASMASMLQRHAFGGVIFFAQNTANAEQTLRLADAVQTANRKPGRTRLLVGVDQEGGKITRLVTGTQTPGNMALGAIGSEDAAREAAGIIGEELYSVGINTDFAPVMDVNNDPANPVIGVRSFSDSPALAAKLGGAYINGLQDRGVISTLKHFPGHGDTGADSHTGLPRIEKTYEELKANELIPFRAAVEAGAEMIMTAHIQFPAVEKETYVSRKTGEAIELPATLSKTILTDILRNDLGFEGVVITDAMNMNAVAEHFDPLDAAVLAINAGVNILLMPVSPDSDEGIARFDAYIEKLAALVENGIVSADNVNESVRRILRLKYEKGLFAEYDSDAIEDRIDAAKACWGSEAHHEAEWALAKRAITLVKNDGNTLPFRAEGKKLVFLAAYPNEVLSMQYGVERLRDEGKLPEAAEILFDCYTSTPMDTVLSEIGNADCVIAISELYRASALDPREDSGKTCANLDRIINTVHAGGGKFVLISANLPYDVARFPMSDAILICWSDKGMSGDPRVQNGDVTQYGPNIPAAVYLALSQDEGPTGTLPVNIPKLTEEYVYSEEILYPFGFGLRYTY